jgi:hypothetical protein
MRTIICILLLAAGAMIAAAFYHAGYRAGQTAAVVPCFTLCTAHANQRIDALLAKLASRNRDDAAPCTSEADPARP